MGWDFPYIPHGPGEGGLVRLIAFIDNMAYDQGLDKKSVSHYYSGAKCWHLHHLPLLLDIDTPGPWRDKGVHHPWVSQALRYLPETKAEIVAVPRCWIKQGYFRWSRHEYVAIAVLHGWIARRSEFIASSTPEHQVKWSMVSFLDIDGTTGALTTMPSVDIARRPCGMVKISPDSRKHQSKGTVRDIPGRVNITNLSCPSEGLDHWVDGCMATTMQTWYIITKADQLTEAEAQSTPMLADEFGVVPSGERLTKLLKQVGQDNGANPKNVTLHGMRHGQISDLVNGQMANNALGAAAAAGHKDPKTLQIYTAQGLGAAQLVTAALSNR